MRNFRIQVVDDQNHEIIVEFPLPTTYQHNGLGGGTETSIPDVPEKLQIASLFKQMVHAWNGGVPASIMNRQTLDDGTPAFYTDPCDKCDYVAKGRSGALAGSNLKLHKKFKHEGAKVGK